MRTEYFAVINRAAGGGRCGKLAAAALDNLRRAGLAIELAESQHSGHGTELARDAYQQGFRRFIALGGDGTSYEIVNGLFPEALQGEPVTLAFQPLGTGNSFLYDFSDRGVAYATEILLSGQTRPCDVMRLTYRRESQATDALQTDTLYFTNLMSVGYTAEVASMSNRWLKGWGSIGYLLGILCCLFNFQPPTLSLRLAGQAEFEPIEPMFLAFCNSQFTGGRMHLAPQAKTDSGLIEYVRCNRLGLFELLRNLPKLYDGSYLGLPAISRAATPKVEFDLQGPLEILVDGEILHLHCLTIDVLPGALQVAT